jgi:hypothetical protein
MEFTRYHESLVKYQASTKSGVNARVIEPCNVKSSVRVTEKVAPTLDFTHLYEYLARNPT